MLKKKQVGLTHWGGSMTPPTQKIVGLKLCWVPPSSHSGKPSWPFIFIVVERLRGQTPLLMPNIRFVNCCFRSTLRSNSVRNICSEKQSFEFESNRILKMHQKFLNIKVINYFSCNNIEKCSGTCEI